TALASGAGLLPSHILSNGFFSREVFSTDQVSVMSDDSPKSIIGPYGPWLAQRRQSPGQMSFLHSQYSDVEAWKRKVIPIVKQYVARPAVDYEPVPKITKRYRYDGLDIEEMEWSLPYGHPTKAVLLKPTGATGPMAGVLGLHDHGGSKYLGLRKITRTSDEVNAGCIVIHRLAYAG